MADTKNYHLHLTEDGEETTKNFIDWRKELNGAGNSNMEIIDAELAKRGRVFLGAERPEGLAENDTWLVPI